jgi:hypothetical protein
MLKYNFCDKNYYTNYRGLDLGNYFNCFYLNFRLVEHNSVSLHRKQVSYGIAFALPKFMVRCVYGGVLC